MTRPQLDSVPAFYMGYVQHVKNSDMLVALRESISATTALLGTIPEEKGAYRYAPGKWSIKELLAHMNDVERIMSYRALRFARNDKTALPGFEEKDYAPEANAHGRSVRQLSDELVRLRACTVDLFAGFTPEMLRREGTANNVKLSVLNLGYIIAGHETHHRLILAERYLKS